MPVPSSWRSLAAGAASKAKGYLNTAASAALNTANSPTSATEQPPPPGERQSWEQWARHKLGRGKSVDDLAAAAGVEQISLFPGWATKQFAQTLAKSQDVTEFALEVSVSGYATALKPPEFASRTERTLMRVARGFAALPKLPEALAASSSPPSPRLEAADSLHPLSEEPHSDAGSSHSRSSSPDLPDLPRAPTATSVDMQPYAQLDGKGIALLHSNLDSRLRPFWAQPLVNRIVRLSLYLQHRDDTEEPLFVQDVLTSAQGGAFNVRFRVPFERMCTHPRGVHLAFGGLENHQHIVLVHAHLLPPPPSQQQQIVSVQVEGEEKQLPLPPPVRIEAEMSVPLGGATVRVISDVDDTIKSSEVLGGVRSMFRNVFVRPLDQVVIRGMSEWYKAMYDRGVRFHYVSNGPFELLTPLKEFFAEAALPPGSLRLKYYATRSMFNWLSWEPAGERKRAGVAELLDAFPSSQFILIGDTGEHDLELYATLAAERPGQVLAIYVRDVSTVGPLSLDDPAPRPRQTLDSPLNAAQLHSFRSTGDLSETVSTGQPLTQQPRMTLQMQTTPSMGGDFNARRRPPQKSLTDPTSAPEGHAPYTAPPSPTPYSQPRTLSRSASIAGPASPRALSRSSTLDFPGALDSPTTPTAGMTPAQKRKADLQARVDRAREIVPRHIVLRIFREPQECAEVWELLEKAERDAAMRNAFA